MGARTAARLLAGGALLEDLPRLGRLTGRTGQAIQDRWADLLTWRELARLDRDVPLPPVLTGQPTPPPPAPAALLTDLGLW